MGTLTVTGTHDYSGEVLPNTPIDTILFDYGLAVFTIAKFDDSQFDGVQISTTVGITSDNTGFGYIAVNIDGTFSAAGWTFNNPFRGLIQLQGGSGADTITGNPLVVTAFIGGEGADTLIGGDAGNLFAYFSQLDVEAGETITGGSEGDTLEIRNTGGVFDFTGATLTDIDKIIIVDDPSILARQATTLQFSANQIETSGITQVEDTNSTADTIIISGATVDLSTVNFNWNSGVDLVRIFGTSGVDSLTGSNVADIIDGGGGKDSLTGGLDADKFKFDVKTDSVKGVNRDVIEDFSGVLGGEHDQIDLSPIDAKKGHGNQDFHFIGKHHFHDKKGELHYVKKAGFVIVEGDINGDGKADFQIEVRDVAKLGHDDFIL